MNLIILRKCAKSMQILKMHDALFVYTVCIIDVFMNRKSMV